MERKRKKDRYYSVCGLALALLALSIKLQNETETFWGHIDGWGINMLIMALGLAVIFLSANGRRKQKCPVLSVGCCFFAICTVLGKSYLESGSWNLLIYDKIQICKACLIGGVFPDL